jgi:hypothetical protein
LIVDRQEVIDAGSVAVIFVIDDWFAEYLLEKALPVREGNCLRGGGRRGINDAVHWRTVDEMAGGSKANSSVAEQGATLGAAMPPRSLTTS